MAYLTKVLLLESDFSQSQQFATEIRKLGMMVSFASSAENALPTALNGKPDVVVINSDFDGGSIQALKDLRSSANTAHIPVLVTNISSEQLADKMLKAGAQLCFNSDADKQKIVAAIKKAGSEPLEVKLAPAELVLNPERMKALENTNLLDCPPEEYFDRLTALTAKLLDVPTALMSLVDKDRQFFMGQFGLGEPWSSARQTPISHSFCQWVVAGDANLIVEDASKHPVLCHNGAFTEIGVVAYAGVPLTADPDQAIGSFCALDSKPHVWTEWEIATLEDLGKLIDAFIIMRKAENIGSETETANAKSITPSRLVEAVGSAINGVTRILGRGGDRLGDKERKHLRELVDQWSEDLKLFTAQLG